MCVWAGVCPCVCVQVCVAPPMVVLTVSNYNHRRQVSKVLNIFECHIFGYIYVGAVSAHAGHPVSSS